MKSCMEVMVDVRLLFKYVFLFKYIFIHTQIPGSTVANDRVVFPNISNSD